MMNSISFASKFPVAGVVLGGLLRLPGSRSALKRIVVEQREDCAVVGQETPRDVDHPLALLIRLCVNIALNQS